MGTWSGRPLHVSRRWRWRGTHSRPHPSSATANAHDWAGGDAQLFAPGFVDVRFGPTVDTFAGASGEASARQFGTLGYPIAATKPALKALSAASSQAKATVFAPAAISSTTLAAPTMVAPLPTCSSVIPRGFVHEPHSHTAPPLPTNSEYSSLRTGSPCWAIPSAPPSVPSQTASIVQSTTASWPAVAAMFAATNGSVARSGSSLPYVQLKISLSLIVLAPS